MYTLSVKKECGNLCTFKPITLFVNTMGKKVLMSVVFQNTVEPPASLLPLGEVQGVARVKQALADQVHLH